MLTIPKPLLALKASDLMSRDVVAIPQDLSVRDAARLLVRNRVSGGPVVAGDGRCVGVISADDFLRWAEKGHVPARLGGELLPVTCSFQRTERNADGDEITMCTLPVGVCPIQRRQRRSPDSGEKDMAVCSEPHCVLVDWQVVEMAKLPMQAVREVMTPDPVTVAEDTCLEALARRLVNAHVHRVIVVDDERRPIGVLSTSDISAAVAYGDSWPENIEPNNGKFRIHMERRANRAVVHCAGHLGEAGAAQLQRAIHSVDEWVPVIVDMAGVDSLDDEGAQGLREMFEVARARQATLAPDLPPLLRLVNLPTTLREEVESAGLGEASLAWPGEGYVEHAAAKHTYRNLLPRVQAAFPVPVSDATHDSYFVKTVAHALDRVDKLKTGQPYLGEPLQLEYATARNSRVPEQMSSLEDAVAAVAGYLQGHVLWGHPYTQEQVIPPATIAALVPFLLGNFRIRNLKLPLTFAFCTPSMT